MKNINFKEVFKDIQERIADFDSKRVKKALNTINETSDDRIINTIPEVINNPSEKKILINQESNIPLKIVPNEISEERIDSKKNNEELKEKNVFKNLINYFSKDPNVIQAKEEAKKNVQANKAAKMIEEKRLAVEKRLEKSRQAAIEKRLAAEKKNNKK